MNLQLCFSNVEQVLADSALDGGDVLPGFRCPLADLLAEELIT
jgi:hypothetical protein